MRSNKKRREEKRERGRDLEVMEKRIKGEKEIKGKENRVRLGGE